ncbi:protein MAIN-LIKE 1-like [Arachis stenosperma]|uniref:protein MAIN-LIKE 1-like n=1 Tax=Arachis stenosperma TaxID=217475 RepID=UPI0025AD37BF|nr:protein MAIN-LIKE 1-like [Arachis stenosperma]
MVEFEHDWPLASALIERWRPESYMFHLPCGEMTIILHDVAYKLGLKIDGDPFSGCIGGDLEEDTTEERLLHYTREYIMQVIRDILFSDASNSQVHIRWLPLLEDLDTCDRLSWGSVVLAWLYRRMCRVTEHSQHNLSGCVSLLLYWAYHHIRLLRPNGFETRRFELVKRWVEYHPDNDRGKNMLRHYRRTLNGIGILYTSYTDLQLQDVVPPGIAL